MVGAYDCLSVSKKNTNWKTESHPRSPDAHVGCSNVGKVSSWTANFTVPCSIFLKFGEYEIWETKAGARNHYNLCRSILVHIENWEADNDFEVNKFSGVRFYGRCIDVG